MCNYTLTYCSHEVRNNRTFNTLKHDDPMHFHFVGVVLFPGATLPLRVIQDRFKVAIDKALRLTDAPCTIGVVRIKCVQYS
jgi:hypothetical protein